MHVVRARGKNRGVHLALLAVMAASLWLAGCGAPATSRTDASSRAAEPARLPTTTDIIVPDIAAVPTPAWTPVPAPALARPDPAEYPQPAAAVRPVKSAPSPTAIAKAVAIAVSRSVENAVADQKEPPSVVITRDVPYDSIPGVDPRFLSLDIYSKRGLRNRPVVIFVHGGGWSGGDKADVGKKPEMFTTAGDVFVSINYRLLPAGRHPENVRDVARAIAWIRANAGRFGGNPAVLFLIGHSAGAHLAALVVTDERYLAAVKLSAAAIKGVVLLDSNAYNIPLAMKHVGGSDNVYTQAFGRDAAKEQALWQDASPALHIAGGKGLPSFLVVHANHDVSRKEQAEDIAGRLRAAGVRADLLDIPDRDHVSLCELIGQPGDKTTRTILDFYASLGA